MNVARMDRVMFERSLVRHSSGVHLLSAPQAFSDIRLVTPGGVSQILALARGLFPYVVVDLDDCFHEEQVQTLRQSGVTLFVLRLDFTSLRNAQRILAQLEQMEVHRVRRSRAGGPRRHHRWPGAATGGAAAANP